MAAAMNGMMSFTGTMEEEFAHGSVGTMFLLMGLSWYLLSEYSGLQNGLLCFAIWAGFWIPTVVMGLRHLIRKAQQEVAEEGEKRLPWLRKQAAGAAIVAKQKREEGDDEAAIEMPISEFSPPTPRAPAPKATPPTPAPAMPRRTPPSAHCSTPRSASPPPTPPTRPGRRS